VKNDESKSISPSLMSLVGRSLELKKSVNPLDARYDYLYCNNLRNIFKIIAYKFGASHDAENCSLKMVATEEACLNARNCAREAAFDWNSTARSNGLKAECCGQWDEIDCVFKENKKECTEGEYEALEKFISDNGDKISKELLCRKYMYGSYKCHFPWWATLLIVLAILLVIGVVGFLVLRFKRAELNYPQ
jgi:hypothetical protein